VKPPDTKPSPVVTDYRKLIDSTYLGQWDLQRDDGTYLRPVVEIESVTRFVPPRIRLVIDKHTGTKVPEKNRRIEIRFRGKKKAWLAGPVSQVVLAGMFGRNVQDWIGKRVTLYVDPSVRFGRDVTGGVRVSDQSPDRKAQLAPEALDNEVDEELAARMAAAASEYGEEEA
jgi:hypothetical protein